MIERLSSDSRRCAPGVAFLAYPGEAADGRAYIGEAIGRGAPAVLWEESGFSWRPEWRVPNAAVRGLKEQAGPLAHGSSYIQTVGFDGDGCPDAKTILTYSQSTNPTSKHYADQTRLYAKGGWVTDRFCAADVRSATVRTLRVRG